MAFNSYIFLLFFSIVLLVNYCLPKRIRYLWLLIASYYFYMSWNARYALLLLTSTLITYLSGLILGRLNTDDSKQTVSRKKLCVFVSVFLNLGILFFFKYFSFSFESLNSVSTLLFATSIKEPSLNIILPVGISFYTFQALSYTIDVYRGDTEPERNFFRYALFVSFFPQLVAGPIERSKNLLKQLRDPEPFSFEHFRDGVFLMLYGFFMKIVVADRVAIVVNAVYNNYENYHGLYLILATAFFAVQIYCDFAGYSTIAIGSAEMLGIRLMENFHTPYLSQSCAEFWRRWHISLSSWFRDYLYIPLGGNRKGKARKLLNILIIFAVSGLWHGASWSFVIWGVLNGLYQVVGELSTGPRKKLYASLHLNEDSLGNKALRILITFLLIDFAWVFFRASDLPAAIGVIRNIFSEYNPWVLYDGSMYSLGLERKEFGVMLFSIAVIAFTDLCNYRGVSIRNTVFRQDAWFRWLFFAVSVTFIVVFGIWGTGYESDAFIYFQF